MYSAPAALATCKAGVPTAVTFRFGYSAAQLRRSYVVRVDLVSMSKDGSIEHTSSKVRYTITSHKTGTFTHTFTLPSDVRSGWQVYAEAVRPIDRYNSYTYVARSGTLSCTHPALRRAIAPTVAVSPVNCKGVATITFDARHATGPWYWIGFAKSGGFRPGPAALRPGSVTRFRMHFTAGDVWEMAFSGSRGRIDVGRYTFRKGC